MTGLTVYAGGEVFGKLVQLLHEAAPKARRIGVFMSYVPPFHPQAEADPVAHGFRSAAGPLGLDLRIFEIATSEPLNDALAAITAQGVEALERWISPEDVELDLLRLARLNSHPAVDHRAGDSLVSAHRPDLAAQTPEAVCSVPGAGRTTP